MPCGWEGNRSSGVTLALHHRLKWFIHLRAHGLRNGDEHPAYTPVQIWRTLPVDDLSCQLFCLKRVAHTRLLSVGFRSWSRFLAVSLQVTWVINPVIGYHCFPPGLQLPAQPLRGLLPVLMLGEQRHDGCEQFVPKTVTRQRCGCDLNLLHLSPARLTTRLPSHHFFAYK